MPMAVPQPSTTLRTSRSTTDLRNCSSFRNRSEATCCTTRSYSSTLSCGMPASLIEDLGSPSASAPALEGSSDGASEEDWLLRPSFFIVDLDKSAAGRSRRSDGKKGFLSRFGALQTGCLFRQNCPIRQQQSVSLRS